MRSMVRRLALAFFVVGVPMAACARPSTPVGERHGTTHMPSAAVRDAAHRDFVRYTVWYPAAAGSKETPITVGPPAAPLFNVGSAAADAAIAKGRFPTLLLSHGNGGSAPIMGWFGIAMARAGYVVIAVDHPGNNGMDEMTVAGSTLIWERAEDLKAALKAVLADRDLAPHVDTARLGVAGFSAGGFAALAAAGARVDVDHFIAFCRAHPGDSTCKAQKESPEITFEAHLKAAATPELAPFMRQAKNDHAVPGIRAVFVMAPGAMQAFDPEGLKSVQQPVSILLGKADDVAQPATNGELAARLLPHASIDELDNVGHYDFLATCTQAGHAQLGALCNPAVAQDQTHKAAIKQATAFFAANLR
ncbi:MAG TPA: alpha/beta hydrolase [Pinirhizobacter sp.]|uniref:alpha/beta hydrolase family protein n=1 Tax=Pinirhizobacter sp. TaxID=2950432 RepID=UPI002C5776F6|nr:alpha/beta hydrolase [Pinirhizobacter sp.]HMH67341.1 alpha/beta hydrolase [Pinirhizobacter sp.]